jgi:hypothetical protein
MSHGFQRALRKSVLFLASVTLSAVALAAQDVKPAPNTGNAPIPTTAPDPRTKPANLTPPPGKMRGLTNPMRWEAAKKTADRKNHSHGKGQAPLTSTHSEVKP